MPKKRKQDMTEEQKLHSYWYFLAANAVNKVDRNGNPVERRISKQEIQMLLDEAGITIDDIGRERGTYQLARHNDLGHYELGNCRFILCEENRAEVVADRDPWTDEMKQKQRDIWTPEKRKKASKSLSTPCFVHGVKYPSRKAASEATGINAHTLGNYIRNPNKPEFYQEKPFRKRKS